MLVRLHPVGGQLRGDRVDHESGALVMKCVDKEFKKSNVVVFVLFFIDTEKILSSQLG